MKMKEYIDRDLTLAKMMLAYTLLQRDYLKKTIDAIPAADVAPVVHAHWVNETDRINHWHCSNCEYVIGLKWSEYHYCPRCGARMDEEADE